MARRRSFITHVWHEGKPYAVFTTGSTVSVVRCKCANRSTRLGFLFAQLMEYVWGKPE